MKISHECAYCQEIYTVKTGTTKQHHKDIKCPFCEHEEVLLINGDGGDYGEKKLNNYQTIIAKNYKKIENQKNEITRLQNALNMANSTVAKQIDEIKRLNDLVDYKNENFNESIKRLSSAYESQLKVHENELDRRLTIIHYLEDRLFNKGEN